MNILTRIREVQSMTMRASPIPKNGNCPTGYNTSGAFCVPGPNARPAIAKNGNCPTGWNTQGNYCVKKSNVE